MGTIRNLWAPNIPESQPLFFGGRLVSRICEEFQHPAIQTKIMQHFGRFFHQIKVCPPIEKIDFIETVCRRSRRLEAFLYEAAQDFKVFQIFKIKIKK
jgi:hypothetical protein